jgi:hypothetical protein
MVGRRTNVKLVSSDLDLESATGKRDFRWRGGLWEA